MFLQLPTKHHREYNKVVYELKKKKSNFHCVLFLLVLSKLAKNRDSFNKGTREKDKCLAMKVDFKHIQIGITFIWCWNLIKESRFLQICYSTSRCIIIQAVDQNQKLYNVFFGQN